MFVNRYKKKQPWRWTDRSQILIKAMKGLRGVMVFNTTFNNSSVISWRSIYIGGGNRSTRRKPLTCLTFSMPWAGFGVLLL